MCLRWGNIPLMRFIAIPWLAMVSYSSASTPVSGTIATSTWSTANSPYIISDTLRVPVDATLRIEPGVDVIGTLNASMIVEGALLAIGTEIDSIRFLPDSIAGNPEWHGIRFTAGNSSQITYARISGASSSTDPDYSDGCGAVAVNGFGTELRLQHSVLTGNSARPTASLSGGGGALSVTDGGNLKLTSCVIARNTSAVSGGGIYANDGILILNSCRVISNTSQGNGGGLYSYQSDITLTNSEFTGNEAVGTTGAGIGGGAIHADQSALAMLTVEISGNEAPFGGGVDFRAGSAEFIDCQFEGNLAINNGGALFASELYYPSHIRMVDCDFIDNIAGTTPPAENVGYGGAISAVGRSGNGDETLLEATDCVFHANKATRSGGALALFGTGVQTAVYQFHRCRITNNQSSLRGAGVYATPTALSLTNCTLDGNTSSGVPDGLYLDDQQGTRTVAAVLIESCIARDPVDQKNSDIGIIDLRYSNSSGGSTTGTMNIDEDPQFVDMAAQDYHLRPGSPCIDTGSPYWLDADGSRADMGATGGAGGQAPVPRVETNASAFEFSSSEVDTLVLSNTGTVDLRLISVTELPAEFAVSVPVPITISPGDSISISLFFFGSGGQGSTITIGSNDPGQPVITIELLGVGSATQIGQANFADDSAFKDFPQYMPPAVHATPNPFNPRTTIRFNVPWSCYARVDLWNTAGQLVRTLSDGLMARGVHTVDWDGTNDTDSPVSSGTYFCRVSWNRPGASDQHERGMVVTRVTLIR
jgi:predicted outer membrane repeat protein